MQFLCVWFSETHWRLWNLTDVTLADENTNSILTDKVNRTMQCGKRKCNVWKNVKHRANDASNDGHRPPQLWPVVRSILCVVPLYRAHFYANANADCGRGYKNLCPKYFMIFPKKVCQIWAYAKKIWPNGLSLRRVSKMQLRDVDLRSIGHSIEKLWPKKFSKKIFCILPYKTKNIRSTISWQVRDKGHSTFF